MLGNTADLSNSLTMDNGGKLCFLGVLGSEGGLAKDHHFKRHDYHIFYIQMYSNVYLTAHFQEADRSSQHFPWKVVWLALGLGFTILAVLLLSVLLGNSIRLELISPISPNTSLQARRCDSYLRNYQSLSDPLTGVGARRCYRI